MTTEADRENRSEMIMRTFALLTAKLEDAATLAADGQAPQTDEEHGDIARRISAFAGEVETIAGTLAYLLRERDD